MSTQDKLFGTSLYYMNDQNIRDGLLPQKIKAEHLIKILKDKSILVSDKSTKEELVDMLKTIRFDYFDYCYLSSLLENPDRKESTSSIDINQKISVPTITKSFENIKKNLIKSGIELDINVTSSRKVQLTTSYIDIDHSKPPMRQKTRKSGVLEFDIENDNTLLNFPANKTGIKIKELIVKELSKHTNSKIDPIEFDFEHSSMLDRTLFFTKIISSMHEYEVFDVISVSVKSVVKKGAVLEEEHSEEFTGSVRHAVLKGEEILSSKIYKSLGKTAYYIYKITWKFRHNHPTNGSQQSDCYTAEIEFSDKDKAKGFKYVVKSVQRYSKERLNITSSPLERTEQESLSKLIYQTAITVYNNVKSRAYDKKD